MHTTGRVNVVYRYGTIPGRRLVHRPVSVRLPLYRRLIKIARIEHSKMGKLARIMSLLALKTNYSSSVTCTRYKVPVPSTSEVIVCHFTYSVHIYHLVLWYLVQVVGFIFHCSTPSSSVKIQLTQWHRTIPMGAATLPTDQGNTTAMGTAQLPS